MDIAKSVFEAIDIAFNKKQNDTFVFAGAENVVATKDVLYDVSNTKTCLLDYYYVPTNKKQKYPVIFYIHGGGFMAGGKEYRRQICTWLALEGFFVVNVNYGLSPECFFPEPICHLVEALNWINISKIYLNLDTEKVVVAGDSAGAYYAAMLGAITKNKKLQKAFKVKPKVDIKACVLNCGLYDIKTTLETQMFLDLNKKVFESYTGIKEEDFDKYKFKDYISPLPFIDESFPPCFVIYAEKDIFCRGQSEELCKILDKFDIYYESYHSKSVFQNHCFSLSWTSEEAKTANLMLMEFLDKFKDNLIPARQSESKVKIRRSGVKKKTTQKESNKKTNKKLTKN